MKPGHHCILILIALCSLALYGCNAKPPATSPAASSSTTAKESESSPTTSTAHNTDSTAANSAGGNVTKTPVPPTPEQIAKWGVLDHQPLLLLTCYDGFSDSGLQCAATSPNGKQFVVGGAKLTLWNPSDSKPVIDLLKKYKDEEVERPILSVGISPDGTRLAAGDQKGTLRIWNVADQNEVKKIPAHEGRLTQLAFSPDSKMLATTSYSGEVRLWNLTDGKQIKALKVSDQEVVRLIFISDRLLATAGSETNIWNVESGQKETVLTKGYVSGPALGLSSDRRRLAFNDSDSKTQIWDVEKATTTGLMLRGGTGNLIEFSQDGKLIATSSGESIRLWNAANGDLLQVIDADGDRTVGLRWLGESRALLVASEQGRVRIWGATEAAKAIGVTPLQQPLLRPLAAGAKKSLSSAQLQQIIDVRSFPKLPASTPQWSDVSGTTYNVPASQSEAEQFYRHFLGRAGWKEIVSTQPAQLGLRFQKDGCELSVTLTPLPPPAAGRNSELQVSLQFAGNYNVSWLPRISEIQSQSSWASFSSTSYRTKANLTDVEVAILRQFHKTGWTASTRLNASSTEEARSRSMTMHQGGSVLTVSIGYPADSTDEVFVQTGVNVSNKSLPVPPDSGWIEFDSSTDLQLVANSKLTLAEAVKFYDTEMAAEGWLSREAGRQIKEDKAWLPYIRGQQDALIRLVTLPEGKTRILVGSPERSSWQLQKPPTVDAKKEQLGIQAADLQLPKGATAIKFEVDEKQIQFELSDMTPPKLADQIAKQLEALEWKREKSGVISDEYVLATFSKEKAEIQFRGRAQEKKTSASMSGDGLLWSKPLPTPPVRISYGTWLRRDRKTATLDQLDEFAAEMSKIPAGNGK